MCFRFRARARPEPARKPTPSPDRAGKERCPKASSSTSRPPRSSGFSGRIYCTGTPEDYAAVHALQDACKVTPLSAYGKDWTPPAGKVDASIDMKTAVREQVNALSGVEYFRLLAELLKANPPAAADAPMLPKLAQIGVVPGKDFDPSAADPAVLEPGPEDRLRPDHAAFRHRPGDREHQRLALYRRRPAFTGRITSSGLWSRPSASAPTGRKTRSIRHR